MTFLLVNPPRAGCWCWCFAAAAAAGGGGGGGDDDEKADEEGGGFFVSSLLLFSSLFERVRWWWCWWCSGSPFPFPSSASSSFAKASLNRSINSAFFPLTFKRRWAKRARSSATFSASSGTGAEDDDDTDDDDDDDEDEEHDTWGWRRSPATETGEPSFRRFVDAFSKRRGVRGVRRRRRFVCDDARDVAARPFGTPTPLRIFKLVA